MTRDDFKAWLQEENPREVVGWSQNLTGNPIAIWLYERFHEDFEVTGSSLLVDGAWVRDLESWERRFIERVDALPADASITARIALAMLRKDEDATEDFAA